MAYIGPYQVYTIDGPATVARVSDWNKLAVSTNSAAASARSGAVTDAKAYADTEFAADRVRLNAVEAKNITQDAAIAAAQGAATADAQAYVDGKGYIPAWKASTAYALNQRVIAPHGDIVSAKTAHTSGANYVASSWNPSADATRLTAVEILADSAVQVIGNLNSENLNTITEPGVYYQASSTVSTPALNYPMSGRGRLTVDQVSASVIAQEYWATFLKRKFVREYTGTTWGAWSEPGAAATGAGATGFFLVKPNLSTEDLDTVQTAGIYGQSGSSNATLARHYPVEPYGRGTLTVKDVSNSIVSQEYVATFLQRSFYREFNGTVWNAWKELGTGSGGATGGATIQEQRTVHVASDYRPDAWAAPEGTVSYWTGPSGTERIGWGYRGGGYVGKLALHTDYTTMQIKKTQSNDEIEVSCLDPAAGKHVTHRIQGKGPGAGQDDQRRIEEAWLGTYTGTTVSKDLLIMPRSNAEWAFQIDVGGNQQFAPYHGTTSVYAVQYEAATITDGNGDAIDITGMAVDQVLTGVAGLKIRQRLHLEHPDAPGVRSASVDEVHTISPEGMLQSEAVVTFHEDVVVGSNYAPMTPVDQATFGRMKVEGGSTYTIQTTPPASTEYLTVTEGHAAQSVYFWSTTNATAFVAVDFMDRASSFMVGHPSEDTTAMALRIEQRSTAGLTKLYPQPFAPGSTIPAGTVWRPSAQWRYGQVANAASYA